MNWLAMVEYKIFKEEENHEKLNTNYQKQLNTN